MKGHRTNRSKNNNIDSEKNFKVISKELAIKIQMFVIEKKIKKLQVKFTWNENVF
jgi:hypothetical protein